jgi:ribulose-phosphate 3-epimerase
MEPNFAQTPRKYEYGKGEREMKKIIVPAVIAKDQEALNAILQKISDNVGLVQLDVMDGKFVPNQSLDFDFELDGKYKYEAHLMVKAPDFWIETYGNRIDTIIAHYEATPNPEKTIRIIKNLGKKAALALNPETGIEQVMDYLNDLDQVLIMTVHPGFYGSPFLPKVMDKIAQLRQLRPELDVEVDGGINPETIVLTNEAGANMFVSGSYLVKADNMEERVKLLLDMVDREG